MKITKELENSINELMKHLNDTFGNENREYAVRAGKSYTKIMICSYGQYSAYAFIANNEAVSNSVGHVKQGDILKAASWNKPAKHARGNVFNADSWKTLSEYSPGYLK